MAQLNRKALSRTLISGSNDSFRKEVKKFKGLMKRDRAAFASGSSITGLKASIIRDFEQFALLEGMGEEERLGVMIGLSGLSIEKVQLLANRNILNFEEGELMIDTIMEDSSAGVLERENTILRILEGGEIATNRIAYDISKNQDPFCDWSQDQELHLEILDSSVNSYIEYMDSLAKHPNLDAETIGKVGEYWLQALEHAMEIQRIAGHTYIATRGLGIELPTYMRGSLENGLLSPTWEQLTPEKYRDPIWRIGFVPPEEIAKELLKMLFPKKWEKLLKACMNEIVAVQKPQKPVLPANHISLAKRLVREYPEAHFPESYVKELGEACGWDDDTVVSVVELEYYGISLEDAIFLVHEGLDDKIVGKHTLVASILEVEGIAHKQLHYAFKVLSENGCWDLMDVLHNYFRWMELMPGDNMEDQEDQELSAVLAFVSKPPAEREGVYPLLKTNEDEIFEALLELESGNERVERTLNGYTEYSSRFVKNGGPSSEEEEDGEVAPIGEIERPHQSLQLPSEAEDHIRSKGILVENVKRAIIYGLRLSSRKSAIGGKYFPITAFRHNVRTVLSREGGNPEERVKVIEDFLYKEGVISRYKQGDVVKLNLKDDIGQHNDPSEVGQQILDSVISWKVEFDRRTTINGTGS
ncbi:MAG: hypothetical protein GY852_08780 [bacterium]|nr:hypothetical protein [bacterium]